MRIDPKHSEANQNQTEQSDLKLGITFKYLRLSGLPGEGRRKFQSLFPIQSIHPSLQRSRSSTSFFEERCATILQLKENEKRSLVFIVPEFESFPMLIFENFITLLRYQSFVEFRRQFRPLSFSLQIQSISISFVVGLCGGDHSLQRLVSSRVASKLSIDTIYDSSARKYFEYVIKAVRSLGISYRRSRSVVSALSVGKRREKSVDHHSGTTEFHRSWILRNVLLGLVRTRLESQ